MNLRQLFNRRVMLGALLIAGLLLLITVISIGFTSPLQPSDVGFD